MPFLKYEAPSFEVKESDRERLARLTEYVSNHKEELDYVLTHLSGDNMNGRLFTLDVMDGVGNIIGRLGWTGTGIGTGQGESLIEARADGVYLMSGTHGLRVTPGGTLEITTDAGETWAEYTEEMVIGKLTVDAANITGVLSVSQLPGTLVTASASQTQYYLSTSDTTVTGGAWSAAVPTWSAGHYIWTRMATTVTYADGNTGTYYSTAVYDEALTTALSSAASAQSAALNANAREQLIYLQAVSGTVSVAGTTTWVTNTGESTASDTAGLTPVWTTKRPTYRSNYPVIFTAIQREKVDGTVTCTTPVKDDTTTVIDGGHITTGAIDASRVTVTNLNASNITTGTLTGLAINNGSGTFTVDAAGNMTASNAAVTGTVTTSSLTATGGTIGGFTITGSILYDGITNPASPTADGSTGLYVPGVVISPAGVAVSTANQALVFSSGDIRLYAADTYGAGLRGYMGRLKAINGASDGYFHINAAYQGQGIKFGYDNGSASPDEIMTMTPDAAYLPRGLPMRGYNAGKTASAWLIGRDTDDVVCIGSSSLPTRLDGSAISIAGDTDIGSSSTNYTLTLNGYQALAYYSSTYGLHVGSSATSTWLQGGSFITVSTNATGTCYLGNTGTTYVGNTAKPTTVRGSSISITGGNVAIGSSSTSYTLTLNGQSITAGGSSGGTWTKLWTNSSPTSSYTDGTESVAGLYNYDLVMIEIAWSTSQTEYRDSVIIPYNAGKIAQASITSYTTGGIAAVFRECDLRANIIMFGQGNLVTGSSKMTSNIYAIPISVWGYK